MYIRCLESCIVQQSRSDDVPVQKGRRFSSGNVVEGDVQLKAGISEESLVLVI